MSPPIIKNTIYNVLFYTIKKGYSIFILRHIDKVEFLLLGILTKCKKQEDFFLFVMVICGKITFG